MVRSPRIVLAVLALSAGTASVDADSGYTYWQVDPCVPGDWHDPAHWTLGVPTSRNGAVIQNGGTARIDSGTAVAQRTVIGSRALPDREVGGTVIQTGGRAEPGYILTLGHDRGSKGVYTLIGGSLSGGSVTVGSYYGSGEFHQIGGISTFSGAVAVGGLRYDANQAEFDAALGLYELSGGQLASRATEVGCAGRGRFVQSGGSHEVRQTLTVGGPGPLLLMPFPPGPDHIVIDPNMLDFTRASAQAEPADALVTNIWIPPPGPSEGRYELSGGQLAADHLLIQRTGRFTQTGGAAAVGLLTIRVNGQYQYLGGTLEVSAGLDLRGWHGAGGAAGEPNAGILDFGGTSVTLTGGGIMDFSQGSVLGAGEATVSAGPDSLVILPAGFDPAAEFGQFVAQNLVHVAGSDLVIGEGEGFSGRGSIADHVDARGRITAAADGGIDVTEGIMVRGGQVDLGSGRLTVKNDRSGISAGRLDAGSLTVDDGWFPVYGEPYTPPPPPRFTQTAGDVGIAGTAAISSGTYALYDGTMTSRRLEVGGSSFGHGASEFLQAGGTVNTSTLHVGRYVPAVLRLNDTAAGAAPACSVSGSGSALPGDAVILPEPGRRVDEAGDTTYRMRGGRLSVGHLYIDGFPQPGSFVQTGGDVVAGRVSISGRDDSYVVSGGRLTAGKLDVGHYRQHGTGGTLAILSPAAEICVTERLSFGHATTFLAVPGATIHITGPTSDPAELWPPGSTFSNWSTDPAALSGLGNLKLIFEGGLAFAATLEVAGEDRGAGYAGFFENFALDTLQIGDAAPASVQLVDLFDNHPDVPGHEALYVKTLIIGPGSSLDLNGLTIYYLDSEIAPGTDFTNGAALPVPEPATLALLAVGAVALFRRRTAGACTRTRRARARTSAGRTTRR